MKKKRNKRPPRKMNPVFLVFCEGETEEAYINFLRRGEYHRPVKLISHIIGLSITPNKIKRYMQAEQIGPSDKIASFLMYDLDAKGITEKLAACNNSACITSNPCVEFWYLLHNDVQEAAVSTDACIEKLKKSSPDWANYKKGTLTEKQKRCLWENRKLASGRAQKLSEGKNPSSLVYRLLETLDNVILQEVQEK